jgi:hypothetical protein
VRLDEIIKLTPAQRRRLRLWGAKRTYRMERRKPLSRDELIDYLRRNSIRSSRVLEKLRKDGDPTLYDFRKEFKTWQEAEEVAFGKEPFKPEIDAEFVLKAAVLYDVWTYRAYREARKLHPEMFPSVAFVYRKFTGFKEFVVFARGFSLQRTVDDYRALWRKLGRRPLIEDCKTAGLLMDMPMKVFGSKAALDAHVDGLNKQGDKVRGKA